MVRTRKSSKEMRVAVVGGNGFVGKSLLARLDELGMTACILDIIPPPPHSTNKFYRVDITDSKQVTGDDASLDHNFDEALMYMYMCCRFKMLWTTSAPHVWCTWQGGA